MLTVEEEKSLHQFGKEHGLTEEQIAAYIEAELKDSGARRLAAESKPAPEARREPRPRRQKSVDPKEDFMRMLRLSGLDSDGMADETRDAFVNMAENLGLEADEAEDLVDLYLDEADKMSDPAALPPPRAVAASPAAKEGPIEVVPATMPSATDVETERSR